MRSTMRRASSVPSPPRGVDTAGMAGLVGSVNDATQQAACDASNADVVRFLSQLPGYRHENPAACDNYALRWAARHGRCDVVQYLCELPVYRGVHPGADDNGAIQWACCSHSLGARLDHPATHTGTAPHPCGRCVLPIESRCCRQHLASRLDLPVARTDTAPHRNDRGGQPSEWRCCHDHLDSRADTQAAGTRSAPHQHWCHRMLPVG